MLANFPFSDDYWWLMPEQQTDDKTRKASLKKEIFGKEGYKDPYGRFGRGHRLPGAAGRLRGTTRSSSTFSLRSPRMGEQASSARRACFSAASQKLRKRREDSTPKETPK